MIALDALKAATLLLVAVLLQVAILVSIQVGSGHPDIVLVALVAVALLRGSLFGAVAGFWAGLVFDVATLGTLGITSLVLTLAGYWSGRFGEVTSRSSSHAPPIAVALATAGVAIVSGLLHFMLGSSIPASQLLAILLPSLALNLLLVIPVYRLLRRLFPVTEREPREVPVLV